MISLLATKVGGVASGKQNLVAGAKDKPSN